MDQISYSLPVQSLLGGADTWWGNWSLSNVSGVDEMMADRRMWEGNSGINIVIILILHVFILYCKLLLMLVIIFRKKDSLQQ